MRNLVVSICGDRTMHKIWSGGKEKPNFDLFVVYYGECGERFKNDGKYYDQAKGTKFSILDQIASRRPELFDEYDAILVPDDDILFDTATLNHFFDLFHKYELHLAQPAIFGWMSVPIVAPVFESILRYVSWVEIMTPCFSREAFAKCKETFSLSKTNWGLEYLWFKQMGSPQDKMAIIDDAVGIHSRPCFFGDTYTRNKNTFEGALKEVYDLLEENDMTDERFVYSAVPRDMDEWNDRPSEKKFWPFSPVLMEKLQEFHTIRNMFI